MAFQSPMSDAVDFAAFGRARTAATGAAVTSATAPSAAAAFGKHAATFVGDYSHEDGEVLPPMVVVRKAWTLRNDGPAWQPGVQVVHVDGPLLSAPPSGQVQAAATGATIAVTVRMVTPAAAGHYRSRWTLMDAAGNKFGPHFWFDFSVSTDMGQAFVRDVTVPDGTTVLQGHPVVKTWLLKNTGAAAWAGVYAVHKSGPRLGAQSHSFEVDTVCSGKSANVSITFTPDVLGAQKSVWQLVSSTGEVVGPTFFVDVVVASSDQATAAAAEESKEGAGTSGDIHVRTLTGRTFHYPLIPSTTTVLQLKNRIQDAEGIPVDQQRIVFEGVQVEDAHLLSHYNIRGGSTLYLILRLRGKPVVYLYPEHEVKLAPRHSMTTMWPPSEDGQSWDVIAKPGGLLSVPATGRRVPYLFWEAAALSDCPAIPLLTAPEDVSDAADPIVKAGLHRPTVVAREALGEWLDASLAEVGLSCRERCDMVTYWLPQMEAHAWSAVRLLAQAELPTAVAELAVAPAPSASLRVFMVWKGVDGPVDGVRLVAEAPRARDSGAAVDEAEAVAETPMWRRGQPLALVEWGGSCLDDTC